MISKGKKIAKACYATFCHVFGDFKDELARPKEQLSLL